MSNYKKAVYTGTFDLFTNGHFDIVKRSLKIFDELIILIAVSSTKKPLFDKDQRLEMLISLFKDESKVKVDYWDGLIVDYAKKHNIGTIVRGLRPLGDFETEFHMATMNNKLCKEVETIFFATSGEHYFLSSTFVKEVLNHKGDISKFVPKAIFEYVNKYIITSK